MFRKYYEDQGIPDPRDSRYKPNLLYNIHYRPPEPKDPPKFKVVTKVFNPSVCTCGEHGCEPHYRMEREVVWLGKEGGSEADSQSKEGLNGGLAEIEALNKRNENEITQKSELCVDVDNEEMYDEEDSKDSDDDDYDEDDDDADEGETDEDSHHDDDDDEVDFGHYIDDESVIAVTDDKEFLVDVDEECGSAFGIMMVFCNSEIHTGSDVKEGYNR